MLQFPASAHPFPPSARRPLPTAIPTAMKPILLAAASLCAAAVAAEAETTRLPFYGEVEVIDTVDCTQTDHRFEEHPAGASRVETILDAPCRVLPVQENTSAFMKWRLGEGKGVKPDGAYVVVIEYPDDVARDYIVRNNGNNSRRSFYTGSGIGDPWEAEIVGHHPESLRIPQSGKYMRWCGLTFTGVKAPNLQENGTLDIATEGFDLILAQYKRRHHPESAGIAARRIQLCRIPDEKALWAKIPFPPAPLPRRHIFWREEMSDGASKEDGVCAGGAGTMWWEQKCRAMKILGQNTFCKDLLEFGHNQDWDPNWKHGQPGAKSWKWMWGTNGALSDLWARLVPIVVDQYGFDILPYYEYSGGIGAVPGSLGPEKRAQPLNGEANYTHITWSEGKARVDITDPDTLEDLKYVLEGTILRFKPQVEKGGFLGAWFRPRPGQWPVSFADATRARFGQEANGGSTPTRADLQNNRALYDKYIDWYGRKRAEFCDKIRRYLEENGVRDAIVVMDNDASEPGHGLADRDGLVTDDPDAWRSILPGKGVVDVNDPSIVSQHLYLKSLRTPSSTWGRFEWQHACPGADPEHYSNLKNVWIALPFHNLFSVNDPGAFAAFRNGNGTETLVRHYGLNEHMVKDAGGNRLIGYAIADFERAGRACMLSEVNAMANGDPVNLGYLMGTQFSRGFPGPVAEFNRNFLALPALPSRKLDGACAAPDVTLRRIDCVAQGKGAYYALVHTGMRGKKDVKVRVPAGVQQLTDIDGVRYPAEKGFVTIPHLKPWQLMTFWASR